MELELHPDASRNFNEKVEALLLELSPVPPPRSQGTIPFIPDSYVHEVEVLEVGGITRRNGFGDTTGKFIPCGNQQIGLSGEGYQKLNKIAVGIQQSRSFRRAISVELLIDLILQWMCDKYQGKPTSTVTDYVTSEAQKKIEEVEIWLPINMTHIQSAFQIGNITFKTFSREMFDNWEAKRIETFSEVNSDPDIQDTNNSIKEYIQIKRKELQGLAAATITVHAEPERARQIAFEEAEAALAILRFFSPANIVPQAICYSTLLGQGDVVLQKHFILKDGLISHESVSPIDPIAEPWVISSEKIEMWKTGCLNFLSHLLLMEKRSKFQQAVLDNLLLYSRGALATNLSDKLLYILSPLESLLLKDGNEALQQNISERMAFIVEDNPKKRLAVIQNFKDAYKLRSSFVHHGQAINSSDIETVQHFMKNAWVCFTQLLGYSSRFETQEDFINALEMLKLSGGSLQ